jgi:hypothetical protein
VSRTTGPRLPRAVVVRRPRVDHYGIVTEFRDPIRAESADAPEALPEALPDALVEVLSEALRGARPGGDDVAAALVRGRVAGLLFGVTEPVRIGRYEIESRVGAGGGGEVFVARDPELSRRVAIKLVRAAGNRDRMLAEGHALARLSHPNIVPVYDAGAFGDQVYVVMELVEGDTLRAYCDAAGRRVREIAAAYRQAADGLAAAHRAGIIHRDFKPDNVVVGLDGRVRVVDFGLARAMDPVDPPAGVAPAVGSRPALGTPRYMAPEQAAGETLTAAVDQYALCASLRDSVLACVPAVPRWLDAIIRRGMASAPAARYPSTAALASALARDPVSRWRTRGVAAGALGLAAAAFVIGRSDRAAVPSCDDAGAGLAATWNPVIAARTAAHLTGLATPYAHQAESHVTTTLEGYAASWRSGQRAACAAHRDGLQSAALFDRRVGCLARARAALGAAVSVVGAASADQLADAIVAIGHLPDLDRCADPDALTTAVAPPAPAIAAAVATASDELSALDIEIGAGRDVRPRIAAVIATARALGYAPLIARALRLAGRAALAVKSRPDAVAPFAEATTLALSAGDSALAVETFAGRMYAAAMLLQPGASNGLDLIEAIAAGLPASEYEARARLAGSVGSVALAAGQRDAARAAFERALGFARQLTGPAQLELATAWSSLALVVDDPARRIALSRERIAIIEGRLGAGHPSVLTAQIAAAHFETHGERVIAALAAPCDRLVELQPEQGMEILDCQAQLGWLAFERGDLERARVAFGRALGAERGGGHGYLLPLSRAYLAMLAHRWDDAAHQLDAADAELGSIKDPPWWLLGDQGGVMLARGVVAHGAGRDADARTAFAAAHDLLARAAEVGKSPRFARQVAAAQLHIVRSWPAGPLPAEVRRHGEAALAWVRSAGGYDEQAAELSRALAR